MRADLLAGVRPAGVWDAVSTASQGSWTVVGVLVAAALMVWPLALVLRRRRR